MNVKNSYSRTHLPRRPAQPLRAEAAHPPGIWGRPGEALWTVLRLRVQVGAGHQRVGEGAGHRPPGPTALVLLCELGL